jgi:hypothetical protein
MHQRPDGARQYNKVLAWLQAFLRVMFVRGLACGIGGQGLDQVRPGIFFTQGDIPPIGEVWPIALYPHCLRRIFGQQIHRAAIPRTGIACIRIPGMG